MDLDASFECEACGTTVKATVKDWAAGKTLKCRNGHRSTLRGDGAKEAQAELDKLDKALKNFGK